MRLGKQRYESKYMAIKYFYENKGWSINWMCKALDISRAAYYKWKHREVPQQELENIELANLIKDRIMKKLGIHSVIRSKKKKYTSSTPEATAENVLQRDFYASRPNQKWATDVTEFKVPGEKKKVYLSAILDLYDRFPVAFVMSNRNDNKLVFDTYDKAIADNPDAQPLFHSDYAEEKTMPKFKIIA